MSGIVGHRGLLLAGGGPSVSNVQLLLHGEGTDGSTTIVDSSSAARAIIVTSSSYAAISTTQAKYGSASIFFPGTASSGANTATVSGCTYESPGGADFGLGAYTIEAWIYPTALTSNTGSAITIWSSISNEGDYRGARLYVKSTGSLKWDTFTDQTGSGTTSAAGLIAINDWYHIAVSSGGSGGTEKLFINGTQVATTNVSGGANGIMAPSSLPFICIGCTEGGNWRMKGHIDELRVTKGEQRYTANFTPPMAAFPDS